MLSIFILLRDGENSMSANIVIVDYGMCNVNSVKNMSRHLGYDCIISGDLNVIEKADKLILPGVGNFAEAMDRICALGMKGILDHKVLTDRIPILGICLGMQILTDYSEEGNCEGFGWIHAETKKFNSDIMSTSDCRLKIPHMGWDYLKIERESHIVEGVQQRDRFYFVHSYYVQCKNRENVIAKTEYGHVFDTVIQKDNIVGTQFHPEKSLKYGMKILKNFLEKF